MLLEIVLEGFRLERKDFQKAFSKLTYLKGVADVSNTGTKELYLLLET